MSKFTITLKDGKRLDDLSMNGSMYVSPVEITMDDLNDDALSEVSIVETDDSGNATESVMENAVCDNVLSMPEGWLFNLREPSPDEAKIIGMNRQIESLQQQIDLLLSGEVE